MSLKGTHKLPRKFWAGFVDGRIDLEHYPSPNGAFGILYTNRALAKTRYQDVRRVELLEVKRGR